MIGRCSLDSHGVLIGILRTLADLISGTETMIKTATQLRDSIRRNGRVKTANIYFTTFKIK